MNYNHFNKLPSIAFTREPVNTHTHTQSWFSPSRDVPLCVCVVHIRELARMTTVSLDSWGSWMPSVSSGQGQYVCLCVPVCMRKWWPVCMCVCMLAFRLHEVCDCSFLYWHRVRVNIFSDAFAMTMFVSFVCIYLVKQYFCSFLSFPVLAGGGGSPVLCWHLPVPGWITQTARE